MICNTKQTSNFLLLKPICTFKGTPENAVLEHNEDVTKKNFNGNGHCTERNSWRHMAYGHIFKIHLEGVFYILKVSQTPVILKYGKERREG